MTRDGGRFGSGCFLAFALLHPAPLCFCLQWFRSGVL